MPTISKFQTAAAQWIQHKASRKTLQTCALEVPTLKYSLFVNFHSKNDWFIRLKQLVRSAMSLNGLLRPPMLYGPIPLWIWAKTPAPSTAGSDAECAEHKPVSSARISRTGTPRVKVKPWALYAVITWSVGFMAASIPTQQASWTRDKNPSAVKKTHSSHRQHCATLLTPHTSNIGRSQEEHRYRRLTWGWSQAWSYNSLGLQIPTWLTSKGTWEGNQNLQKSGELPPLNEVSQQSQFKNIGG